MLSAPQSRRMLICSTRSPVAALLVLATTFFYVALQHPNSIEVTSGAQGGYAADKSLTGAVTTMPGGLFMDRHFFSWTGRFTVFDLATEDEAYHIQGKVISVRRRVTVTDAAGGFVAIVQKKLVGLRKVYEVYRYTPAFAGQKATEKDDSPEEVPLYRYAWIQKKIVSLTPAYYYAVEMGEKDPTPVFLATQRMSLNPFAADQLDVTSPDGNGPTVAWIGKPTKFHLGCQTRALASPSELSACESCKPGRPYSPPHCRCHEPMLTN